MPQPPLLTNISAVTFTSGTFTDTTFSDPLIVPVFQPLIALAKTSSTLNASVGDTLTYTIQLNNFGNVTTEVTLPKFIPAGTLFIPGSLQLNGQLLSGANLLKAVSRHNIHCSQSCYHKDWFMYPAAWPSKKKHSQAPIPVQAPPSRILHQAKFSTLRYKR
ncbi:DUF11 domain-containing protein [Paenibacillus kribbensis]|uniref:DUF11 domain-containing protein n=1 Tax=Paenibacillus kribbensis TaxID=172713 RepID=UPI00210AB6D3|nr:DUF11 domain-containing protein [Paenibacillus kribbensis]